MGRDVICSGSRHSRIHRDRLAQQEPDPVAVHTIGGVGRALSTRPSVSTNRWRLRPFTSLPPSNPRASPTPVILTDWLSVLPTLGWGGMAQVGLQPLAQGRMGALPRSIDAEQADIVVHPLPRGPLLWQKAPGAPCTQLVENRVSNVRYESRRGRPVCAGAGNRSWMRSHSASVRSVA